MTEPLPPPDREPGPSLLGRLPGINRRAIMLALFVALGVSLVITRMMASTDRPSVTPRTPRPNIAAEPLSGTIAALSRTLPEGARLAEAARTDRLTLTVETAEPDRLRDALAADPALARLRTMGEAALADGGYRVTLEGPAASPTRPPTAPPPDLGRIAALARRHRLLVERLAAAPPRAIELVVSGREADVRTFAAAIEAGRPPAWLPRWKLSALGDGSVRLDGRVESAARPHAVRANDARPLFATAVTAPVAADAPVLAGIVGRLPDDAVALVRGEDGRAVSVAPGGQAPGGWRLEALSADTAVFARGRERARVSLPPE